MVIAEYADRHLREIRGANMIGLRLILDDKDINRRSDFVLLVYRFLCHSCSVACSL